MFVQIVQYHKCHSATRTLPERYFPFVCHLRVICILYPMKLGVSCDNKITFYIFYINPDALITAKIA